MKELETVKENIDSPEVKKTDESFRNTISIVEKDGHRKWIYPKKPSGRFYTARTIVSIFFAGDFVWLAIH